MIDKQKIAFKKAKYGNSFPDIAEGLSEMFNIPVSPEQAAKAMYIMKKSRVIHSFVFDTNDKELIKIKEAGKKDSESDMKDYKWISENYEEYLNLVWNKEKLYE